MLAVGQNNIMIPSFGQISRASYEPLMQRRALGREGTGLDFKIDLPQQHKQDSVGHFMSDDMDTHQKHCSLNGI